MKKLYLVDVSSLFFRAFFAIPHMTTSEGLPTNALYGLLSMTIKLLRDIKPDYMAFCFDRKEPTFRKDIYPEYKANRIEMPEDLVPQMPYIRELIDLMGIPAVEKAGFEADDLIGTLATKGKEMGIEVVIVSGDKDFAQLVNSRISMYDSMKEIRYDEQGVVDKWGVRPEQFIDYLALVGDSSDNIPGVRGIGPKGAQKLLAEYKDLEGIYENIDKITAKAMKRNLQEGEDNAYLSKELVTIACGVDLGVKVEDLKLRHIDKEKLSGLLSKLEFKSFARKLFGSSEDNVEGHGPASRPVKSLGNGKSKSKSVGKKAGKSLTEVHWSLDELKKNIEPYSEVWAIESERGLLLGTDSQAIIVAAEAEQIGAVLDNKKVKWKGFCLKEVWKTLNVKDPSVPLWDHMLAAYVLRPGNIDGFDRVYLTYTGQRPPDLAGPVETLATYIELEPILRKKLEEQNGESTYFEIELPLVNVLYHMEQAGIFVDAKQLEQQSKDLEQEIAAVEKKVIEQAGESFNIASPKQLGQILFEKLKLPPSKKTKTGYSTGSDVLTKLADAYPICNDILEFRELSKLKSTYVDALPQLINKKSGRVHTRFRMAATATGRLSSIHPNLQNIPIRTARGRLIRRAFVAGEGKSFISADYSQIELRVLAHITEDEGLCQAFADDVDIHAATASQIFNVPLQDVTADLRRKAKAVNFGIAYGQGAFGLAESLGISRGEASEIIAQYFERFHRVKQYMEDIVESAKANGYVETIFGRRRYIDEIKSKNANLRRFGERAAINAPMQGAASDLVKMAMIHLDESVEIPMLLQVHDELLFECPDSEIEDHAKDIKDIMEHVVELRVPLRVNVAWGTNWEEAHA